MNMNFSLNWGEDMPPEKKAKIKKILKIVLVIFLVACFISICFGDRHYYGHRENKQVNTISFSGHGEVQAVPDIANVSFTIRKEATTVKGAQDNVAKVEKDVLAMLKSNNIAEKDIKTVSVSFNPKYEYKYEYVDGGKVVSCSPISSIHPCPGRSVIVGYEAYESITVKIRNTDDAGKVIQALGTLGVTDLNGPNFAIDNEDALKVEARQKAINDAKDKAKELAKELGVHLVKITSFSESGNYPVPMMYDRANTKSMATGEAAPKMALPKGENTISSDVTITYEIR